MSLVGSIQEVLAHLRRLHFGGASVRFEPGTPKTVTVGTTATDLLPGNPQRLAWIVVNQSTNFGFLGYGNQAKVTSTRGFRITQNGGSMDSRYEQDGETVQDGIEALSDTASGVWFVVAWELVP